MFKVNILFRCSILLLVSSNGRVFHVFDAAPRASNMSLPIGYLHGRIDPL